MPADRSLVRLPSATARGSQGSRGGPRDNATYTKRLFLSARGYNATAHLRACIARDPRDLTHVEEVFVDGSASWTDEGDVGIPKVWGKVPARRDFVSLCVTVPGGLRR